MGNRRPDNVIDMFDETDLHKSAFRIYCAQPDGKTPEERIEAVAKAVQRDIHEIGVWAHNFDWESRLARQQAKVDEAQTAEDRKKDLRQKLSDFAEKLTKIITDKATLDKLSVDDGKTLSQLGNTLDKIVHTICALDGQTLERITVTIDKPLEDCSDEELAALAAQKVVTAEDDGPGAA